MGKLSLTEVQYKAHETAVDHGWWEEERNVGEMLALIHSEVSEALEDWRDGRMGLTYRDQDGKPEGFPSELADIIIRVADLAQSMNIDLESAIQKKMEFNANRPYRHGGKRA